MKIQVNFTTQLKAALGQSNEPLSLDPAATVHEALAELAARHPTEFNELVLRNGELLPSILLSVNDKQADLGTTLADGDTLTLLSAISGG